MVDPEPWMRGFACLTRWPGLTEHSPSALDHASMPVWTFAISDDPSQPDQGSGFVRADSVERALALVDHPAANLFGPIPGDVPSVPVGEVVQWDAGKG